MQARGSFVTRLLLFGTAALRRRTASSKTLYERLIDSLAGIETINTHERIMPEAQRVA